MKNTITPEAIKPVYLVHDSLCDEWIFLGWIANDSLRVLYNLCEREFDWMCGFEDSGFDKPQVLIYAGSDWAHSAWMGMRARAFLERLWGAHKTRLPEPYWFSHYSRPK